MTIRGAFKFRGACNAVFSLNDEDASKGVVTHSRFDSKSRFIFSNQSLSSSSDRVLQNQWKPCCSIGFGR